jgi:hypothetical protein
VAQTPNKNTNQVAVLAAVVAIFGGLVAVVEPVALKVLLIAGQVALAIVLGSSIRNQKK